MKGLKRAETKARMRRKKVEQYHWFLFPAFLLLLIELTLSERRSLSKSKKHVRGLLEKSGEHEG
jgi:hypothetical protein